MNKLSFSLGQFGKTLLLATLASILMVTTVLAEETPSKTANGDSEKVVRQVVDNWIQIATEQYKRGFYIAAEKSFLRAKDYEQYLTAAERERLNEGLQQAHNAALERTSALAEKEKPEPTVAPVSQLSAAQQAKLTPVAERPKEIVLTEAKEAAEPSPAAVVVEKGESVAAGTSEPAQEQTGYIGVINRRISIIRGRIKAVVNDAQARAEDFISKGQFDKASQVVEAAEKVVYENQQQLGDYLFNQYSSQLRQLAERIAAGQKQQAQQKEEEKRTKAEQAQQEYKDKMAVEREKRIADLFRNALNFQKQQRYEEALGQLEMLLAIDPQHNQALILKQTLEDIVSFRQQLEVEKEKSREKVGTLIEAEKSAIPYADEMTYPKNWREITAKPTRQPEEAAGQDPANAVVEKQLDEIVNLPGLSPEMPLSEALKLLEDSVEPPLKIWVDWGDLSNNADVYKTTAINMDPLMGVRLRAALDRLLKSVSGVTELGYVVKDGVVNVATKQSLPSTLKLETRVYDVSILVGRPADYYVSAGGTTGGGGRSGGGGGGSGGGGGGQTFEEYFEEGDEENLDRETLRQEAAQRMDTLIALIQQTVAPTSWYDAGGEATITTYENKKLVIYQSPDIHHRIEELLRNMRKSLGNQVSIEARFLVVGENFLEEIGIDMGGRLYLGEHLGASEWRSESFEMAAPEATGVPGSWDLSKEPVQFPTGYPPGDPRTMSRGALMGFFGGKFGGILDDLQVDFLIRATQARRDTESLVAPKVTVLSGESATLQVSRTYRFPLPPTISAAAYTLVGGGGGGGGGYQQNYNQVSTGPTLNITPTITTDKKHVLLNIDAKLVDAEFKTWDIQIIVPGGAGGQPTTTVPYTLELPQTERSRVRTRVSVPDGGTLLLGGLKRTAGAEKEVGVPILSKIPIIGRAFTNRSKVNDQKILLILVKPTIILQEEADTEAIAAMEGQL